MGYRDLTFGDAMKGCLRSILNRTSGSPSETRRQMLIAQAERLNRENFGNGTVRGDRNWGSPFQANRADGRPVTISFGQGNREGQTLVADGHITIDQFYGGKTSIEKGHDHFLRDGSPAGKHGDRGRYTD